MPSSKSPELDLPPPRAQASSSTLLSASQSTAASTQALSKLRTLVAQLQGDQEIAQQTITSLTSNLDAERDNVKTLRAELAASIEAAETSSRQIAALEAELAKQKHVTAQLPQVVETVADLSVKVDALEKAPSARIEIQAAIDDAVNGIDQRLKQHMLMTEDLVKSHQTTIQVMKAEMDKMRQQRSSTPSPAATGPTQAPQSPRASTPKRTHGEMTEPEDSTTETHDEDESFEDHQNDKRPRVSLGESVSSEEASLVENSLRPQGDISQEEDEEIPVAILPSPVVSQLVPPTPKVPFQLVPPIPKQSMAFSALPFELVASPVKSIIPPSPSKHTTIGLPPLPSTAGASGSTILPPPSPSRGSPAKTSRISNRANPMGKRPESRAGWLSAKTPQKRPSELGFGFGLGLGFGTPGNASTPFAASSSGLELGNEEADSSLTESEMSMSFSSPGVRRPGGAFRAPSFEFGLSSLAPRLDEPDRNEGLGGAGLGSESSSGSPSSTQPGYIPSSPAFPIQLEPHGPNPDQAYGAHDQARKILEHDHGSSPSPPPVSPDKKRKYGSDPRLGEFEDVFDNGHGNGRTSSKSPGPSPSKAAYYGINNPRKWG